MAGDETYDGTRRIAYTITINGRTISSTEGYPVDKRGYLTPTGWARLERDYHLSKNITSPS